MHDMTLASRKAEEAAWRRYQAAEWLEGLVGPLGLPRQPSEREFISCLRNGQFLCNAINRIQPGAVPKLSYTGETQPLTAYQYFENVRNFLVAVEDLKLPAFEASDLERDTLDAGSAGKVVDCILGLKAYHEWKQMNSGDGLHKHMRSPLVMHSANRMNARSTAATPLDSRRQLFDASCANERQPPIGESGSFEGSIVKLFTDYMVEAKENVDRNLFATIANGTQDSVKLFMKIISRYLEEQPQGKHPELDLVFGDLLKERGRLLSTSSPLEDLSTRGSKCCRTCSKEGNCNHRNVFEMQEKELLDLKTLLVKTKREFEDLQSQFQRDLKQLGNQVQEMSTAALGYHKVVKENRNLYNMVQDLKGNIRVYCRIRPIFNAEAKDVVDFIGEDGSLVIVDPSKPHRDGRKVFRFNRVFSPLATQGYIVGQVIVLQVDIQLLNNNVIVFRHAALFADDVYMDTQPLIRSVMDGYNVCIFAYGQTGSGKTHTMSGISGELTKDMGINYSALNDLFELSNRRKDNITYDVHVQMVEIYNEQIRSCTSDGGLSLPDATMHSVKSTADVVNLMKLGDMNRVVSSTALNNRSSRSHSVLTVHVQGKDVSGSILRSCLHLVDLAGSERVDKSEVTGERLKEAQYINRSLSCLGDVITALAQKNSHVPYRNSKLTLLLQDSLGGNAKTLMLAHVNPERDSFGESMSTLKFAQRVSTVELGAARLNKETSEVMQLKEQVENLKKALASKEMQSMQFSRTKEPKSPNGPKAVNERTPPRLRRLSIENSTPTIKTGRTMNVAEMKARKTPGSTRTRRLSLEGPRTAKNNNLHIKVQEELKPPPFEPESNLKYGLFQDSEISRSCQSLNHQVSVTDKHLQKATRSPTNYFDLQIPPLELPKTPSPEPVLASKNEIQIVMQGERTLRADPRTPNLLIQSMNGKGSHIRKSLRTIGKLINGSEKRNQRNVTEARSPVRGSTTCVKNGVSAIAANTRTLRRQSLTGAGSDQSRRSSLGGKSTNSNVKDTRNAKTPPPVHPPSSTIAKRWL
ncbi:hypothetical protein EUGRSUZ_A02334 [Eucalyptus grandis]|uniref:Uncharacterized protein n=2 Tax=Eucalyptus grandis TaxID=71139 RepID=A0ACC3M5P1_EUCGR|nr:hypothetical protein EUGRSUZ_A02334 [Eucalyptus grandis]